MVDIDGNRCHGIAADFLPNKWLTKDPDTTFEQDIVEMRKIIEMACQIAKSAGKRESVFDLWEHLYLAHSAWSGGWNYPPLLSGFGPSLIERAVIDAFCRSQELPFSQALRQNRLGIRLGRIHDELSGEQAQISSRRNRFVRSPFVIPLASPIRSQMPTSPMPIASQTAFRNPSRPAFTLTA